MLLLRSGNRSCALQKLKRSICLRFKSLGKMSFQLLQVQIARSFHLSSATVLVVDDKVIDDVIQFSARHLNRESKMLKKELKIEIVLHYSTLRAAYTAHTAQ
jgi:hypothetical protein